MARELSCQFKQQIARQNKQTHAASCTRKPTQQIAQENSRNELHAKICAANCRTCATSCMRHVDPNLRLILNRERDAANHEMGPLSTSDRQAGTNPVVLSIRKRALPPASLETCMQSSGLMTCVQYGRLFGVPGVVIIQFPLPEVAERQCFAIVLGLPSAHTIRSFTNPLKGLTQDFTRSS